MQMENSTVTIFGRRGNLATLRVLQARDAEQRFKLDGHLKIFSTKLGHAVYICRNSDAARRVPLKNIPVFTIDDIMATDGLDENDRLLILEAKELFAGVISYKEQQI